MKLSVITVNRNNANGLRRTLESTFGAQSGFDDWEQIVVDGASTDGSFVALDKWKDDLHLGWHVSEPDAGIYDAMNKGASHARGDYLLFLNSGDELLPDVLERATTQFDGADLVCGRIRCFRYGRDEEWPVPDPKTITPPFFLFSTIPHQSTFISRELHMRIGGYDSSMRICADRKFFLESITMHAPVIRCLDFPVSRFSWGGVSNARDSLATKRAEFERMLAPVFGRSIAETAAHSVFDTISLPPDIYEATRADSVLASLCRRIITMVTRIWFLPPVRFAVRGLRTVRRLLGRIRKTNPS